MDLHNNYVRYERNYERNERVYEWNYERMECVIMLIMIFEDVCPTDKAINILKKITDGMSNRRTTYEDGYFRNANGEIIGMFTPYNEKPYIVNNLKP